MTATASIFVMRLLPMGFVFINPRYQAFVESQGLTDAQHFLALQGIIISGHPDRHVMRVKLGAGCNEIDGFLKREHRVPWKERWANALAGRGLISKSCREAQMLRAASAAGLNCPDWIAAGEDDQGKAFLLVRALDNIVDLRVYLRQIAGQSAERRATFQELGNSVARIHAQGFLHGDLYSKHVLIRPADGSIHFLDWQRSQVGSRRSQRHRLNDLAALNATIAEHLASPRERLACFRSYLRSLQTMMELRCDYRKALRTILAETSRLLTRRRIREMRLDPPASQLQHLIWLDGEALCVTRRLQELLEGQIPDYLAQSDPWIRRGEVRINGLPIGIQSCGLLIRRRAIRPVARVSAWLRRRRLPEPELQQAGLLFRLERYGLPTPTLLAVGQRHGSAFGSDSFLLTELRPACVSLGTWLLKRPKSGGQDAERSERRRIISEAADLLRRICDVGCEFLSTSLAVDFPCIPGSALLSVQQGSDGMARVVLGSLAGLRPCRPWRQSMTRRISEALARANLSRTD